MTFTDTEGDTRTGEQRFAPLAAIVGGEMTLTEKGQTHHVFNS
nr:hypothetical protein [Enterovibrio nigricans]